MKLPPSARSVILPALAVVVFALAILGAMHWTNKSSVEKPAAPLAQDEDTPQPQLAAKQDASLDCAFHDFMRTRAVVSFYFDVVREPGSDPEFHQRAIIEGDGTRTNFEGRRRPLWKYSLDEDGKPNLASPDGATRIVLYGLKLGTPGVLPVEAGVRSNAYRNLGGECRQSNLG
jgi:hypothetical protein